MTKKDKILRTEIDEKGRDYASSIEFALRQASGELDAINQQILAKKMEFKTLETSLQNQKLTVNAWKQEEEKKFKQEIVKRGNDILAKERAVDIKESNSLKMLLEKEHNLSVREREVQKKANEVVEYAKEYERLQSARAGFAAERKELEVERLKTRELLNDTNTKLAELKNSKNALAVKEAEVNTKYSQLSTKENDLTIREDKIKSDILVMEREKEQLDKVSKIVDSKITEYKDSEKRNAEILESTQKEKKESDRINEENRQMIKSIADKDKELKDRERSVTTREEDVKRRELLLEHKK